MTRAEGICPRCTRPYYLEPIDDPGICCICHAHASLTGAQAWRALTDARRAEVYSYARDFALDCDWRERETLDAETFEQDLDALAPVALVTAAAHHYSGGLVALLLDSRGTA